MSEHTQFFKLPNNMTPDLRPQELLVYINIVRYSDKKTKMAFPSLRALSDHCGAAVGTIKKSLNRLAEYGYIQIFIEDKKQYYKILKEIEFEPFSKEFLDNTKLTFTQKAYLLASQQYMFKENGIGKISYSSAELSKIINMPKSTITKCDRELEEAGFLDIIKAKKQGSGIMINEKFFHLDEFGQAIVFELQKQREEIDKNKRDIAKNTEDITQNIEEIKELKRRIEELEKSDEEKDFYKKQVESLKKDIKIVLSENKKLKQEKEEKEKSENLRTMVMT